MKCLILAAGYATRLYPLTKNYPKPLLKVNDKSIVDWLIEDLALSDEIDEFIVITNHKFYLNYIEWAKKTNIQKKITVIDDQTTSNEDRLGAVKDIQYVIRELKLEDDLLIIAGDNVLDFTLRSFIQYYNKKKTSCCLCYYEDNIDRLRKTGVITIDSENVIRNMQEKPKDPQSNWAVPPFYIYTKEDVTKIDQAINEGCNTDAPGSLLGWMCRNSVVHAIKMPGARYDVGDLKSYEEVQRIYHGYQS